MGAWNRNFINQSYKAWYTFRNPKKFLRNVKEKSRFLHLGGKIKGNDRVINDCTKESNNSSLIKVWCQTDLIWKSDTVKIKRKENRVNISLDDIWESKNTNRYIIFSSLRRSLAFASIIYRQVSLFPGHRCVFFKHNLHGGVENSQHKYRKMINLVNYDYLLQIDIYIESHIYFLFFLKNYIVHNHDGHLYFFCQSIYGIP